MLGNCKSNTPLTIGLGTLIGLIGKMFGLLLIGLFIIVAFLIRLRYTYWQRKGFPHYNTNIPFGCLTSVLKGQRSWGMAISDVYEKTSEKFIGIYLTFRPALLIRDPEMIREILVQNFNSFHDRGVYVDEENDPFSANLFSLRGQKWKILRGKFAPFFTVGKLKGLLTTYENVANAMVNHLDQRIQIEGQEVTFEMKSIFSRYVIDILATVVFGLDTDSFKNPNNNFQKIAENLTTPSVLEVVRAILQTVCPGLEKIFVYMGLKQNFIRFMTDIVGQTVEYREKNNIIRRDIMQMLIQLRNTGEINIEDGNWDIKTCPKSFEKMSIESIAGQAFLFLVAGYETSATVAAYTILEFARNPEVLQNVQADIDDTLQKHDQKLTYEALQEMKYLDLCFMETTRMYPVVPVLNRECTEEYRLPGTNKVIQKGTSILISLLGMHRDPEYFPHPLKYDPERFLETNKAYDPRAFMPFSEGPRHCIAQQMGKIIVKVALVSIIRNYNIEAVTRDDFEYDAMFFSTMPKGGINIKLSKKN